MTRQHQILTQWADAVRRYRWDEANQLWPQLMAQWLKPPAVVDQAYWNRLLDRRMRVLARRDERRKIDDDEWDNTHGDMSR